jgi:hypothetical protein
MPPQATGLPAAGRGFTDPPTGAGDDRWRVALTKQDLRWMTTEEITEAYHAGAVQLETFVFRAGMPTWVTLLEVPEIARALGADESAYEANGQIRPSSIPPPRRSPPRRPAREAAAEAGTDEGDAGDPLPFALVSERASSAKREPAPAATQSSESDAPAAAEVEISPAAPPAGGEVAEPIAPAPAAAPESPAQQPFAANVLSPPSSGATVWVWVLILLAVAIGIAIVLGPRFGFRLF